MRSWGRTKAHSSFKGRSCRPCLLCGSAAPASSSLPLGSAPYPLLVAIRITLFVNETGFPFGWVISRREMWETADLSALRCFSSISRIIPVFAGASLLLVADLRQWGSPTLLFFFLRKWIPLWTLWLEPSATQSLLQGFGRFRMARPLGPTSSGLKRQRETNLARLLSHELSQTWC